MKLIYYRMKKLIFRLLRRPEKMRLTDGAGIVEFATWEELRAGSEGERVMQAPSFPPPSKDEESAANKEV